MANPVLNERMIKDGEKALPPPEMGNWAPPVGDTTQYYPPITDGPSSKWSGSVMTVQGTITATAVLMSLLLVSAAFGWIQTGAPRYDAATNSYVYNMPILAMVGVMVGLGLAFLLMFKPRLARILAPIYAIAEGFFIGAISRQYETFYDGIVVQAAGATLCVVLAMLVLYRTGVVKVTDRFRRIVVSATMGVMAFYLICFVVRLFAGPDSISFLSSPSLLGIGFSILVAGLAASNLALDFDFIEKGAQAGLEKHYEWYAAFGLLVTIVWLYLELLRLISKLRSR